LKKSLRIQPASRRACKVSATCIARVVITKRRSRVI
jgi:hypothetical protein